MKLIIRNLSRDTTETELMELFNSFGEVTDLTLVMDEKTGISKGFGFAEMTYNDEANAAIKMLDGQVIDGATIRVKRSSKGTRKKFSSDEK